MAKKDAPSLIADNRKARHDFNIHETYEAGIALTGTEIKSIRQGKLNLKDSFIPVPYTHLKHDDKEKLEQA